MKGFIILPLAIFALTGPLYAGDLRSLEKSIIERAEHDPESAPDYFMEQIERRPAPDAEKQAVYLYGTGLAYERMGNMVDAIDFYRGAELFGNQAAAEALKRLNMLPSRLICEPQVFLGVIFDYHPYHCNKGAFMFWIFNLHP